MRHREQSVYPLSRCLSSAVNVTPNEKDFFPRSFSYLRVPVNDSASVAHPPGAARPAMPSLGALSTRRLQVALSVAFVAGCPPSASAFESLSLSVESV